MFDGARAAFREDPGRVAVIDGERRWSWSEYEREVGRIAVELGPGPEPVEILLPTGTLFLTTFLAASALGRPACTLQLDWAAPELEAARTDVRGFRPEESNDPVFYVGFTSGTSGRPKPFVRRQRSWTESFGPAAELFSVRSGDLVFLPGSLQHSHFLFGAVFALNRGAAVRMFERFDAGSLAAALTRVSRGVVYLVPTMLVDLDAAGERPFEGVHSVVVSGAKMESHHWEIARRLFPRALVGELYGASELSFVTVNTEGLRPADPGYVGPPFPGVEIEIRPPGLVFVRSRYLFDGYLNGSGVESPVGSDGFMTVGDMGAFDGTGLSLSGRASNLLITGGKNVHPEEVEAQISSHRGVSGCVVVGLPHPRWGEELAAFVVPSEGGATPEVGPLRDHLKERLASYKVPKRWFVVEEIPRTRAGKTDRSRERLLDRASEIRPGDSPE